MASKGVNKVILVGNLGKDPETRFMPSGGAVTTVTLATSESWKDKNTGQPQERTEWHKVSFFNRLAEISGEYLKKGSKIYVEGSLRTRKWQDQSGADRYSTEVVATEMQMLDSRSPSEVNVNNSSGVTVGDNSTQVNNFGSEPSQTQNSQVTQKKTNFDNFDNFDDDIPF